jgi:hypothetical protein
MWPFESIPGLELVPNLQVIIIIIIAALQPKSQHGSGVYSASNRNE